MTALIGVIGMAIVFGVFAMLRPRDQSEGGCTGQCAGCTGDSACEKDGVKR